MEHLLFYSLADARDCADSGFLSDSPTILARFRRNRLRDKKLTVFTIIGPGLRLRLASQPPAGQESRRTPALLPVRHFPPRPPVVGMSEECPFSSPFSDCWFFW